MANSAGRTGLTAADEPTGEQWEEGQVWAHLAEFGAYWRRELRLIVDAGSDDPVPFGRTKRDPHRIAMIEAHRATPVARTRRHRAARRRCVPRRPRRADTARTGHDRVSTRRWARWISGASSTTSSPGTTSNTPTNSTGSTMNENSRVDRADTWVDIPDGSPFPLHNLPFGVARRADGTIGAFVAIGDQALDLADTVGTGLLDDSPAEYGLLDAGGTLNGFAAVGRAAHAALRERLTELVTERRYQAQLTPCLVPLDELTMQLPVAVGDYVDFYSSLHHATNLGRLFRPDGEALLPNWRHLPIGYHGRSGTIVADGTDIARPSGLRLVDGEPRYGPTERPRHRTRGRLSSSARRRSSASRSRPPTPSTTCSGCASSTTGRRATSRPSSTSRSGRSSARASPRRCRRGSSRSTRSNRSGSSRPCRTRRSPTTSAPPAPPGSTSTSRCELQRRPVISRTGFADMYWTPAQQIAHMTTNGADVRPGDLFASGTVSGPSPAPKAA